jgi:hypothetical protein
LRRTEEGIFKKNILEKKGEGILLKLVLRRNGMNMLKIFLRRKEEGIC